jgi:hypothetical protein
MARTYCRSGTLGRTESSRCAAVSAERLAVQLGHCTCAPLQGKLRSLQENATSDSSPHVSHRSRRSPWPRFRREVAAQCVRNEGRDLRSGQDRIEVLQHGAMERGAFGLASAVGARRRVACAERTQRPTPLCPEVRLD